MQPCQIVGPLPDYPQTTVDKVASVIEFIDYLIVCRQIFSFLSTSSSVSSAINFKKIRCDESKIIVPRMIPDVFAPYITVQYSTVYYSTVQYSTV